MLTGRPTKPTRYLETLWDGLTLEADMGFFVIALYLAGIWYGFRIGHWLLRSIGDQFDRLWIRTKSQDEQEARRLFEEVRDRDMPMGKYPDPKFNR